MKTPSLHRLVRLLPLLLAATTLTSCKLPPDQAMRVIQSKGLFAYLEGDYSVIQPAAYSSTPLLAASSTQSMQRPYKTPRPTTSIPYRSTYHSNRHLRADYTRAPLRPQTASVAEPVRRAPEKTVEGPVVTDGVTPAPTAVASATSAASKEAAAVSAPAPATQATLELPYGSAVSGRPGMVTSPYAQSHQLVDVTGLAPGDTVKDPYTGKLFRVPPSQQASAKPADDAKSAAVSAAQSRP